MNEITLGEIIAKIRGKKGYSRKQVCDGLCSTQMLAKIENDEADTDKLLCNK